MKPNRTISPEANRKYLLTLVDSDTDEVVVMKINEDQMRLVERLDELGVFLYHYNANITEDSIIDLTVKED